MRGVSQEAAKLPTLGRSSSLPCLPPIESAISAKPQSKRRSSLKHLKVHFNFKLNEEILLTCQESWL
eukprot:g28875.t1